MTQREDSKVIRIVHPICCGLDVHKESVSACVIFPDDNGEHCEVKVFGTFTDDLTRLREWLLEHDCPVVAMESTGIYWRPVHNVLEDAVHVVLVNARDMRNVSGRKTDIGDSKWIAGLLRHGLLRGSFIPPQTVRQWRDLTRLRKKYVQSVGDYRKRTHKLFESANIKIDSVVSDLFGVTGRNLMQLLVESRASLTLSDIQGCVRGKLKGKEAELFRSIHGFFTDHHRFVLKTILETIAMLEAQIDQLNHQILSAMKEHEALLARMKGAPGISDVSSCDILAEIGPTLDSFPTDTALVSWSGLCPGNNESAGKRKSGKSPVRKHHLKTIMLEVAWAAVKKKGSYFKDKYYRLKARRGAKKAIVAIAHRILLGIYHVIKDGAVFRDLGEDYLTLRNKSQKVSHLRRQAIALGFDLVPQTT
jgi:transposase